MILLLSVSSRISNLLFSFFFFFTKDSPSEVSTQLYVYAICHFFIAFLQLPFLSWPPHKFVSLFFLFFFAIVNIVNIVIIMVIHPTCSSLTPSSSSSTSRIFSQSHSFNLVILAHTHTCSHSFSAEFSLAAPAPCACTHQRWLSPIPSPYHHHTISTATAIPFSTTLFSNALSLLIQHVPRYSNTLFF